jgi:hypothetical protein
VAHTPIAQGTGTTRRYPTRARAISATTRYATTRPCRVHGMCCWIAVSPAIDVTLRPPRREEDGVHDAR